MDKTYEDGIKHGISLVISRMGGMALGNYANRVGVKRKDGEYDGHLKQRLFDRLVWIEKREREENAKKS